MEIANTYSFHPPPCLPALTSDMDVRLLTFHAPFIDYCYDIGVV